MKDKSFLAKQAILHTQNMELNYAEHIDSCIYDSKVIDRSTQLKRHRELTETPKIYLIPMTTVQALFTSKLRHGDTTLLNFASYKKPGGGFIEGSMAQEEDLCHHSILYNILSAPKFSNYYKYNNENLHNGMYEDRAIYSPRVRFAFSRLKDDANIITCAAPNNYANLGETNTKELQARIDFIFDIAEDHWTDTFFIGAWGCGVFNQDPHEVAKLFKEKIVNDCTIPDIIFAIPSGDNYNAFYEELKDVLTPYTSILSDDDEY